MYDKILYLKYILISMHIGQYIFHRSDTQDIPFFPEDDSRRVSTVYPWLQQILPEEAVPESITEESNES